MSHSGSGPAADSGSPDFDAGVPAVYGSVTNEQLGGGGNHLPIQLSDQPSVEGFSLASRCLNELYEPNQLTSHNEYVHPALSPLPENGQQVVRSFVFLGFFLPQAQVVLIYFHLPSPHITKPPYSQPIFIPIPTLLSSKLDVCFMSFPFSNPKH